MKKSNLKIPMRHEAVFSKDGGYSLVVEQNVLLHHEAIRTGMRAVSRWMRQRKSSRPARVLDLACGGAPVIPNAIMAALSPAKFEYTGVDINPGQVKAARRFKFAPNVKVKIMEEDAWGLDAFSSRSRFDWIFIGLNTHHATPEELAFLARKARSLLVPGGLYMNHDKFRPARHRYFPRPELSPFSKEPMRLIPVEKLKKSGIRLETFAPFYSGKAVNWRETLFGKFEKILRHIGCDKHSLDLALHHVRERDYPVSVEEMKEIFSRAGFKAKIYDYRSSRHPLKDYFRMVLATH